MIHVSCRKDFDSDQKFSDQNEIRDYRGDITEPFDLLSESDLQARADGKHVLILIHGYRNPLKNVDTAYRLIGRTLTERGLLSGDDAAIQNQYGLAVGFAWPGGKTRVLGFMAARPSANRSASYLRSLIDTLRRSARLIDIQTHSLGARVALQALSTVDTLWIDNLLLSAPAVDNECLQPKEEFNEALDSCRRVLVYHSKNDGVLKAYSFLALDRALGLKGPEKKDVIIKDCPNVYVVDSQIVKAHGDYRKTPKYFDHWARVLNQEELPRYGAL